MGQEAGGPIGPQQFIQRAGLDFIGSVDKDRVPALKRLVRQPHGNL